MARERSDPSIFRDVADQSEIWLVHLGLVEKVRPALILSGPGEANDRDIIIVIPPDDHTS